MSSRLYPGGRVHQKTPELDLEIAALRPIDYDDLTEAADLATNFRH